MIKYIILLASLFALLIPSHASAAILKDESGKVIIDTQKVAHIETTVTPKSAERFVKEMESTKDIAGPRLIIINSPGGFVDAGKEMLDKIGEEKAKGVKIVCYVKSRAHSMAFNILTNCDSRYASAKALMLVHKIRLMRMPDMNLTGKNLRKLADELDEGDEPYRQANAKAMNMKIEEYDSFADDEITWRSSTLLRMGYLHGLATLDN